MVMIFLGPEYLNSIHACNVKRWLNMVGEKKESKIPFSRKKLSLTQVADTGSRVKRALQIYRITYMFAYKYIYIFIYGIAGIFISGSGGPSLAPRLPQPLFASLPSIRRSVLNSCSANSSQQQSESIFWLRRRRRILVARVSTRFSVYT